MSNYRNFKVEHTNNKRIKSKAYIKILLVVVFLMAIVSGVSYAFYTMTVDGNKKIEMTAGTFDIEFKDGNVANISQGIPMTDNEGLADNDNITTFSITNTGDIDALYSIALEEVDINSNTMDKKWIKYSLREKDGEWSSPQSLSNGLLLRNNMYLKPKVTVDYELKIWLAYEADNSVQGKKFSAKIVVNAIQSNAQLGNTTQPIINIANTSINVIKGDALYKDPIPYEVVDANKNKIDLGEVVKTYEYFDGETIREVDSVDVNNTGIYYIYYRVTDKDGNTGCTVVSINVCEENNGSVPVITLNGPATVEINKGSKYIDDGAFAVDDEDGELEVITIGEVNTNVVGEYIIKYIAKDSNGNLVSVIKTVKVVDPNDKGDDKDPDDKDPDDNVDDKIGPVCYFSDVNYITTGEKLIDLICTDDSKIDNNFIEEESIIIDNPSIAEVSYISGGAAIEKGYRYTITLNGLKEGNFSITLKDNVISDQWGNKNNSVTKNLEVRKFDNKDVTIEGDIGDSKLSIKDDKLSLKLDMNSTVRLELSKYGDDLKYIVNNDNVTVDDFGNISAKNVGTSVIKCIDEASGASIEIFVEIVKKVHVTYIKNGNGVDKISDLETNNTSCELNPNNPSDCSITLPSFNTNGSYEVVGWSEDANSHIGYSVESNLKISDDVTLYTISKIPGKEYTVIWNENGSRLEGGEVSCSANDVYNNEEYNDNCYVDMPTITPSSNTPNVVGWNTNKDAHESMVDNLNKLELNSENNGKTYYAITKNDEVSYTATFAKNGYAVSNISYNEASCTIKATYNGVAQLDKCGVIPPEANIVSEDYSLVGYNNDKDAKKGLDVDDEGKIGIDSDTTLYTITKSNAKDINVLFHKQGIGVTAIGSNILSCTTTEVYNSENPVVGSCSISRNQIPRIDVDNGYVAIGWNSNPNATEDGLIEDKDGNLVIEENVEYYSISKKNAIELSSMFISNGAEITSEKESCLLGEVYNDIAQDTTCDITVPTISRDGYKVNGFGDSILSESLFESGATITLTNDTANNDDNVYQADKTYYAQTSKNVGVTFDGNGSTLSSTYVSCVLNNTDKKCSILSPSITRDGYNTIGFSKNKDDSISEWDENTNKDLDDSSVYYAITTKNISAKFNYYSDGARKSITGTCEMKNKDDGCNIDVPDVIMESTGPSETLYAGLSTELNNADVSKTTSYRLSNNQNYNAVYKKEVNPKFYYYDKDNDQVLYDDTKVGQRMAVLKESDGDYELVDSEIEVPSIISNSKGLDNASYIGFAVNINDKNIVNNITTANDNYYAVYKGIWNLRYTRDSATVNAISKTNDSCDNYQTTNGSIYSAVGNNCGISLPDITLNEGYSSALWYDNEVGVGGPGESYEINGNKELKAKGSIDIYTVSYDCTTNSGVCEIAPEELSYGNRADLTKTASKEGYDFLGWNTKKDATEGLTELVVTKNTTLYAIFRKTTTISLNAKSAVYTGSKIEADTAVVSDGNLENEIAYTYYSDNKCSTKTTTDTGATSSGKAPVNVGSYYAKASTKAANGDTVYSGCVSHIIVAKNITVTAKDQTITYGSSISTSVDKATLSSQVNGHHLDSVDLEASTINVTTNGNIIPNNAKIVDEVGNNVTGNYSISYVLGNLTINKKVLTVSVSAANKVYDGNNGATCTVSLTGAINGHTPSVKSSTGTFSDSNVGNSKIVTCSGISLNDNYSQFYQLDSSTKTTTANITKKSVTVKAKDQTITYGSSISTSVDKATLSSQVNGHYLYSVALDASTTNATDSGKITPRDARIYANSGDVTSNYSIEYATGVLVINVSKTATTGSCNNLTYNGLAQTLASGGSNVTYSNNSKTDASDNYEVTVKANTNYAFSDGTTTKTLKCTISRKETATTGSCNRNLTYNGSAQTLASGGSNVTYLNNSKTDASDNYEVTVKANTNYAFSGGAIEKTLNCTIARKSISSSTLTLGTNSYTYDGNEKKPTVTVKDPERNVTLSSSTDYEVAYTNNVNAGTTQIKPTVTVKGKGNYIGTAIKNFTINVSKTATTGSCNRNLTYNGLSQALASGGSNVTYSDDNKKINAGTYTVTVNANKNYAFSDGNTSKKLTNCTIARKQDATTGSCYGAAYSATGIEYNGSSQTLAGGGSNVTYEDNKGTNAGVYYVTARANDNHAFAGGSITKTLECGISGKRDATTGSCKAHTFNGSSQTLAGGGSNVTYSDNTATNAGTYTVKIKANTNHAFSDGLREKTLSCNLHPIVRTLGLKKGNGVSAIGASERTCSIGSGNPTDSCSVTLPSITPKTGYDSGIWHVSSNLVSGRFSPGDSFPINNSNGTGTALAYDTTAPIFNSFSGSKTCTRGQSCSGTVGVSYSEPNGAVYNSDGVVYIMCSNRRFTVTTVNVGYGNPIGIGFSYNFAPPETGTCTLEMSGIVKDSSGNTSGSVSVSFLTVKASSYY